MTGEKRDSNYVYPWKCWLLLRGDWSFSAVTSYGDWSLRPLQKCFLLLNFWRKVNITLLYIFFNVCSGGEVPEFVTVIWFCFTHWNVFRLEHFGKSSRNLVFKNLDEMIEPTSVATLQWLVCAEYFSSRTFLWFNYVTLFLKYSAASSE